VPRLKSTDKVKCTRARKAGGRYKFKRTGRDAQLKLGATKSNAWRDELVNHQAGDAEDDSRDG
jgi:hypothetical protein